MSTRLTLATVALVAALIGLNFTVLKYGLEHSSPILLTAMRSAIGGPVLLGFALLRGERPPRQRRDWVNIAVVSLSITTVSSALLVMGTRRVPAGVASLLSSTMPLFTAVLTVLLLGVGIAGRSVFGLVVGFAGTVTLAAPAMDGGSQTIGVVVLVLSAVAWAYGTVHMKWQDMTGVSPVMLVAIQLILSAVVLVPFGLLVEGADQVDPGWGLFLPLLYSAIPSQAVTFALLATVVRRASPTHAAASAYLVPLFGVLFGWLIRGEQLGVVELLGGALVVVGVYVVVTASTQTTHPPGG
ncbi:MAG TPA: EamA family transporter [Ilumatobacter sp.]|nr:EamA family transporter [Ilumatobacter sp.]